MDWIILFITSWILIFIIIDWKQFKTNIWCGLLAVVLQILIDSYAIRHGYYMINNAVVNLLGSSVFFIAGPVFTIAVLLSQYHPVKRALIVINVIVLGLLYSLQELLLLARENLVYVNWSIFASIVVNITIMAVLSWFAIIAGGKKVK